MESKRPCARVAFPSSRRHSPPLHTAQLFTVDYPNGDRGGNEICIRVTQAGQPMDLHRFWDGEITPSSNLTRLRNEATALRNRQEFQRSQLTELANTDFKSWAKESFEIRRRLLTVTRERLEFYGVAAWIVRWSELLPCFPLGSC
jgi:S1/P1 Nuclease